MKNGRFQAKDIDDADFLRALFEAQGKQYAVSRDEVEARLPGFPWKVVIAKARALIRSELMTGCACGCSGGWALTNNGRAFLAILDEVASGARVAAAELIPAEPMSPSEFRVTLERKVAEVRSLGLRPPLVPPEGVRPVLLETSDPSRFNLVFVKEENN